jgi:hypothetical protein
VARESTAATTAGADQRGRGVPFDCTDGKCPGRRRSVSGARSRSNCGGGFPVLGEAFPVLGGPDLVARARRSDRGNRGGHEYGAQPDPVDHRCPRTHPRSGRGGDGHSDFLGSFNSAPRVEETPVHDRGAPNLAPRVRKLWDADLHRHIQPGPAIFAEHKLLARPEARDLNEVGWSAIRSSAADDYQDGPCGSNQKRDRCVQLRLDARS